MRVQLIPGHLRASEFTDLLEGVPLPPRKAVHLESCRRCQNELAVIAPYFDDLSEPASHDPSLVSIDWEEVRNSVRDQLLARAVKKASVVPRWTRRSLTPATAWGLSLAALVLMMTLGSVWHFRTAHINDAASIGREVGVEPAAVESALFVDDPTALESEALGWTDTELFIAINQLEESEEETLRELIALAFEEDNGV